MKSFPLVLLATLLAACAGSSLRTATPVVVYDFGLPAQRLAGDGLSSRLSLEVRSPPWFDSLNVDYRLNYDDPLSQREYAGSRWVGAPGTLLAQRLRQQLGIAGATGGVLTDCVLRVELQEFSQVFDAPQQSRAVLQGNASVVDARRRLVAQRVVTIEKPAPTADAAGGVQALVAASTDLGQALADWLATLEKNGALRNCRSTQAVPVAQ